MAKLVTSDGVQVNLFLDLDSHNTGEGTLLYGPKSQAEMDFIVKGFRNFKTNSEYNNKNRLEFHCTHLIEVDISALMSANPTSSSQYTVPGHSDTKLYFVGNDLVLSKTGAKIHRIDLFKSASTNNVFTVNGSSPDASGNVTVTVGNDHSTEISNLTTRVTTLENTGGGGGSNALYAPPQTLFLDRSEIDQAQHHGNNWIYGPASNQTYPENETVYLKYIVPEFENFFDNHSDKYKLTIYSGCQYTEVIISDLASFFNAANSQTSDKNHYIHYDDTDGRDNELWFEFKNNDLILHALTPSTSWSTMWRIYRIDMHLNAFGGGVTTVNGQTGDVTVSTFDGNYNSLSNKPSLFDGNYNSLSNKPSVYTTSQTYSKTEIDNLTSSSGGGGGRVLVFNSSDTYNKPAGVVGLEILMVAGGQGGGSTPNSMSYYVRPTAGGNTTITGLPGGDKIVYGGGTIETLKGALTTWGVGYYGYMATTNTGSFTGQTHGTQTTPYNSCLIGGGQGGYGGEDGGPCTYVYFATFTSQQVNSWAEYWNSSIGGNGGGGYRAIGSEVTPSNKSLSGGQGSTNRGYASNRTYSGDASDWYFSAPLGGATQGDNTTYFTNGGSGKFSGGGGGSYWNSGGLGAGGGGGGIGAGGGACAWAEGRIFTGGVAGESLQFTISVPSQAASYQIEVGAGGDGSYFTANGGFSNRPDINRSSGGGGQGIVIIKEISDLTISTP